MRKNKVLIKKEPGTFFLAIVSTLTGSSPSLCGRVKFSARKFWEGVKKVTWYLF
jgi:hypothetical protein